MGNRQTLEHNRSFNMLAHALKLSTGVIDMADAAYTLTDDHASALAVDPNGNTEILTLPAPTAQNEGRFFLIMNSGGESITLNNASAATLVTILTTQAAIAVNIAGVWYARLLVTADALS